MDNPIQSIATPSLITAACNLLNNLIFIGQHEVVRQIYEHSVDKYLFGYVYKNICVIILSYCVILIFCYRCLNDIPKDSGSRKSVNHYSDTLEMYINICTVLTNCIMYSNEYTAVVLFSPDSLYTLFCFLNIDLYRTYCKIIVYK